MISIHNLDNFLPVFRALGSTLRAEIMELIIQQPGIPFRQISTILGIPISTLTPHIHMLEDCDLIKIVASTAAHGVQKCCYVNDSLDQLTIILQKSCCRGSSPYRAEVPVGHYTDFSALPTCGLATTSCFIGQLDEERYFAHPLRYQAGILWLTDGYLEYALPNFIPLQSTIDQLTISFEIASEAPQSNNNWPSDIMFSLCGTELGTWKSPGDYGDRRGKLNPDWWYDFINQYGMKKTLTVSHQGTYIDDQKLSDVTVDSLGLTDQSILRFRFTALPGETGGLCLFGRGFGDYNQDILVEIAHHKS